jgi:hypothetical protein
MLIAFGFRLITLSAGGTTDWTSDSFWTGSSTGVGFVTGAAGFVTGAAGFVTVRGLSAFSKSSSTSIGRSLTMVTIRGRLTGSFARTDS